MDLDEMNLSYTGAKIVVGVYGGMFVYWFFLCYWYSEGLFQKIHPAGTPY